MKLLDMDIIFQEEVVEYGSLYYEYVQQLEMVRKRTFTITENTQEENEESEENSSSEKSMVKKNSNSIFTNKSIQMIKKSGNLKNSQMKTISPIKKNPSEINSPFMIPKKSDEINYKKIEGDVDFFTKHFLS
jgi:hypothetical protein